MSLPPEFQKENLVQMANASREHLKSTTDFEKVEAFINEHDLVFGVWQDYREPDGVGTSIIKGTELLTLITKASTGLDISFTALSWIDAEQAEAVLQIMAERACKSAIH